MTCKYKIFVAFSFKTSWALVFLYRYTCANNVKSYWHKSGKRNMSSKQEIHKWPLMKKNMVSKSIVHMHITAELRAY